MNYDSFGQLTPLWILQNNGVNRVTSRIASVLREQGRTFVDISVHASDIFETDLDYRLKEEGVDFQAQPTFFMGSVLMLRAFLKSSKYRSLARFKDENYNSPVWIEKHGSRMLNPEVEIMTLKGVSELNFSVFVRPLNEQKLFTGAVLRPETFQSWLETAKQRNSNLSPESIVCVSKPLEIIREWRVLCFDGVPKLWSQYKDGESLKVVAEIESDALAFALEAAKHWVPGELCTLDVAKTSDGYKIVEFNGIHCCGIYGIDPKRFVEEIDSFLIKKFNRHSLKL